MRRVVTFEMPFKLESGQVNGKEHFRVRAARRRKERDVTELGWKVHVGPRVKLQLPLIITLTRIGARELDLDNLSSAFKSVRDAIAELNGFDDRSKQVRWRYRQERAPSRLVKSILPGGKAKRVWDTAFRVRAEEVEELPPLVD